MSVERDEAANNPKERGRRAIFFLIKVFTDGAHADAACMTALSSVDIWTPTGTGGLFAPARWPR